MNNMIQVLVLFALLTLTACTNQHIVENENYRIVMNKFESAQSKFKSNTPLLTKVVGKEYSGPKADNDTELNRIFDEIFDVTSFVLELAGLDNYPIPDWIYTFEDFVNNAVGHANFTAGVVHGFPSIHRNGDVLVSLNETINYLSIEVPFAFDVLTATSDFTAEVNTSTEHYALTIDVEVDAPQYALLFEYSIDNRTLYFREMMEYQSKVDKYTCHDVDGNEAPCGDAEIIRFVPDSLLDAVEVFVIFEDIMRITDVINEAILPLIPTVTPSLF